MDCVNKIYNTDCINGLLQLPDETIDLCITDPPYGMNKEFEIGIDLNYLLRVSFGILYKKMKKNSWFVYTCPTNKIDLFIEITKDAGFEYKRCFFYYKKGKMTDVWMGWLLKSEAILLFCKGKPNCSNSNKEQYNHDVYTVKMYSHNQLGFVNHQSAKSEDVWRHLIKTLSNKGSLVCDPFNGSGTTSWVCKQIDRNCIGFEINKEYCDIAYKRLSQETLFKEQHLTPNLIISTKEIKENVYHN